MAIIIDGSEINNNVENVRILDEKESRRRWLNLARQLGCEKETIIVFAKYDKLLRNCSNDKERKDIGKLGCIELHRLLSNNGKLVIDGEVVIDDEK